MTTPAVNDTPSLAPGATAKEPPATSWGDLARLVGSIVGGVVRHRGQFSMRSTFRAWARGAAEKHGGANLVLNLGVKKLLLVGSRDLSEGILALRPAPDGVTMGEMKRKGMSFLAPHALTISDGSAWDNLRAHNERVLEPGRPHEMEREFLRSVSDAFRAPIRNRDDIRAAMGRSMLGIVFGGKAPPEIVKDVDALFGLVQNPVKRALLGWQARPRRTRVYNSLRALWRDPAAVGTASLLAMAHRSAESASPKIDETVLLEQFPHWMFTFTGSGTDMVTRTLTLILSDPAVRERVEREIADVGGTEDAGAIGRLEYLDACVLEAARLFPPVTRTFHRAPGGAAVRGVALPAGMEILHSLPLIALDSDAHAVRRFQPPQTSQDGTAFDPFLGGARRCPGRSLIMFVSKAALAIMITRQRLVLTGPPLRTNALPLEFPRQSATFRPA